MQTDGRVCDGLVTAASGARYLLHAHCAPVIHSILRARSLGARIGAANVERECSRMKASSQAKVICVKRRNVGARRQVGLDGEPRWAHRSRSVASTLGPVGRAGAYFKPGPRCTERRPLCETVGYARRAAANSRLAPPEGKVERGAVVRPRAPSLHAAPRGQ